MSRKSQAPTGPFLLPLPLLKFPNPKSEIPNPKFWLTLSASEKRFHSLQLGQR